MLSLVENRTDTREVADFVFDHLEDPDDRSILEAFGGVGGDFRQIFKHYLPEWLPESDNLDYAKEAVRVVANEGIARGKFPPAIAGDLDKIIADFTAEPEA